MRELRKQMEREFGFLGLDELSEGFEHEFEQLFKELERKGEVKRYGPYVWGFSFKWEPGKPPQLAEFGNLKPSLQGLSSSEEREPLVDVIDKSDSYEIVAEIPGVEREEIDLRISERNVEIKTTNPERKFYKKLELAENVDPATSQAKYKNGLLSIIISKKGKQGLKISVT